MIYKVFCDEYLIHDSRNDELNIFNGQVDLELNKTGSFTFTIYPDNKNFNRLKKLKSIIQVFQDDYLLFRGRILNDEQGIYNEKKITCEGELAFLLDSIQRPYDFMSGDLHTTVSELFTFFITNHNSQVEESKRFKVGNITVVDPNNYIVRSDSTYLNTWDSINKKLIESLGGYLFIRHEADGIYIDYLANFNTLSSQKIEFGKNLLDFSKVIKGEDIATAIIPLGAKTGEDSDEKLTISSVNGGVDYVFDQTAVEEYGLIFKTVEHSDVTEASNLLTKAYEDLSNAVNLIVSIDLTAVDLSAINVDVNSFRLGTYVKVVSRPNNLDSNFLVQKLSISLSNVSGNKLTLGSTYSTFTEQTSSTTSSYQSAIQQVSQVENTVAALQVDVVSQSRFLVEQNSNQIMQQISHDYYLKSDAESLAKSIGMQFSQTNTEFEFRANNFEKNLNDVASEAETKFQEISKYIRFVGDNIVLGKNGNELTLKIENDRIAFLESGFEVAYFTNQKLYVIDGEYLNSLQIGKFAFLPCTNGNLSFKKVVN